MSAYTQSYGAYQQQSRSYHQPSSSASSASWGPPPFAGPPPLPPGIQVNPQQWQSGYWQYNNYYKPSSAPMAQQPYVPWIPGHNWSSQNQKYPYQQQQQQQQQQKQYQVHPGKPPQQQPAAQQPSYNPYKRQPRAPSEEYLKDPLVENPLGLIDAHAVSVEEYYRKGHTPWIWQTTPLEPDSDDPQVGQQKRNATDPAKQSNGASVPGVPSRRYSESDIGSEPESFTSKIELQPTFSSKIIRTPEHYRNSSLNGTPTSSPRNSRSPVDSLSSRLGHLSISSNSSSPTSSLSRHSSMPNTSSTSSFSSFYSSSPSKPDYPNAPMLTDRLSDEPESMLSPLIFSKTPGPAAPNQLRTLRNHPNPLLSTQSLDTIPEAASPAQAQAPYQHDQHQQHQTNGTSTAAQQQQQPPSSFYPRSGVQHANTMPAPKSQVMYTATAPPPPQLPPPRMPIYPSTNGACAPATGTDREKEAERLREIERTKEREKKWAEEREQDKLQRAIARERERMQNGEYGRHNQHRDEWDREREKEKEREKEHMGSRYTTYIDPHVNSRGTPSPRSHTDSRSSPSSSGSSSAQPSPMRRSSSHNVTPPTKSTYPNSSPSNSTNQHFNSQTNGYTSSHSISYSYSQPQHSSSHSQSSQAQSTSTPPSQSSTSTTLTSPSNPSKLSNPLPPPPQIIQRPPILPVQHTPPPKWRERVRYGFWNRRGDHLTPDGYIVYAPIDKAYPPDLQNHPKEEDGYENHERLFTSYVQRPELPQSLPKHGKPPECPYEAFIVYHYK